MKDPVCDMEVSEKNDAAEFEGKTYHFCCATCKMAFEQNPKQFIKE
ncbi:YHS domain-containing protein [Nitrosopumilus sp.]|nr:YHS domain-containing protein [Nitrosopumilus sp.]